MNRKNVLILLFCSASFGAWAQGFLHPGILHTQADFDRAKEKVETGEEPWTSAYKKLMASPHVDLNWKPNPTEKIIRGGRTPEEPEPDNYPNAYRDVATAYQCALVWKVSGDEAYADKAVQILDAWAKKCKKVTGDSNGCLATGIYGYQFANAGELMRDYEGWNKEDFKRFQDWMRRVFCEGAFRFLETRNGTADDHYWSNWGLCNVLCAASVGILCDDVFLYNYAMEYYKYMENHRYGESLHHLVYKLFPDGRGPFGYLGQMQESNRDQGHATMAVALASDICGTGLNQGDDLYACMDDRIAAGFEYVAAYNSWVDDLPNEPYTNASGTYPSMGSGGRGGTRPNWPRIVNYYENVRGVEVPYCRAMMMNADGGIDAGGGFYGGNSGGYDHLGFTTLMCSLEPLENKTLVPSVLKGSVEYGGNVVERNDVNCIPRGTTVRLTASLRDGEEAGGKWAWDDDDACTSGVREVVLDTTRIYRVRYTNARGVVSTQMFALHVEGDGRVVACEPYCKIEGVVSNDTAVYVKKNGKLSIGLSHSGASVREWIWERSTNGERWNKMSHRSGIIEIPSVSSGAYYRVTLVHKSGARHTQVFRVEVSEIDPYILYDGERKEVDGTALALPKGSSFSLYAEPNSILSKSANSTRIYKWVVGNDTIRRDTLTYHLDDLGSKVADLNDTLRVAGMDTCFSCTLVFQRIASSGSTAETVYRFNVPVYESNTLLPDDSDDYYLLDAESGQYLRNTDARFYPYSEEDDGDYLWRVRRLPATYGSRYMFISRSNSSRHLSEDGILVSGSDYSKHSFNLLYKCTDENLYAIERSSAVSGGLVVPDADGGLVSSQEVCKGFPFRIVKKETGNPDGVEARTDAGAVQGCIRLCGRQGRDVTVETVGSGILHVYSFTGQLLAQLRCEAGRNGLRLPVSGTGWILRYVAADGQSQSLKLM